MNRQSFLQNIVSLAGIGAIPSSLKIEFQKVYLLQFFVRGFQFNEGKNMLSIMQIGQEIALVREPENEFDEFAIATYYKNKKIGFVPAEENEVLARLLDANMIEIMAEITHIEPQSKSWENCACAIYILKPILANNSLPEYLTKLENPIYYTLENNKNIVSRLCGKSEYADNIYEKMVENSQTDEIYSLIHNGFGGAIAFENAVYEAKIIICEPQMPEYLENNAIQFAIENNKIYLKNQIDGKDYLIANIEQLSEQVNKIKEFRKITNEFGEEFYEMIFKDVYETKKLIYTVKQI